jgi:hypothetical protein
LVFFFEGDLMISHVTVKKTLKDASGHGVHNRIDSRQTEGIFFACLIKICIINTHPPIFILFGYKDGIGEPIQVVHFFNKTGV